MLQFRVLFRQPKYFLQTFLDLALDEADLFVHDVQSGIVRHLLAISAGSFLLLSSLVKRHYSVTLPQFLYLLEEEVDLCKLLLQSPITNILNSTALLRIQMRFSFSIGLSVDAIPHSRLIVGAMCDGLAVIEQFFIDGLHVLFVEVGVDFGELRFGKNCGGCSPALFDVRYHQ